MRNLVREFRELLSRLSAVEDEDEDLGGGFSVRTTAAGEVVLVERVGNLLNVVRVGTFAGDEDPCRHVVKFRYVLGLAAESLELELPRLERSLGLLMDMARVQLAPTKNLENRRTIDSFAVPVSRVVC